MLFRSFLAWRQLKKSDLEEQDFEHIVTMPEQMFEDLKKLWTSLDSKLNITQDLILNYEEAWKKTFIYIPNFLYYPGIIHSGFKNEYLLNPEKSYRFYQLSSSDQPIKILKEVFQKRHPGVNFAKWNPSDIFAVEVKEEQELFYKLESCKTSVKLNEIVDKAFDNKQMVVLEYQVATSMWNPCIFLILLQVESIIIPKIIPSPWLK